MVYRALRSAHPQTVERKQEKGNRNTREMRNMKRVGEHEAYREAPFDTLTYTEDNESKEADM